MNIGTLIPQFFYDLIGRIVPGCVIICCGLVLFEGVTYEISTKQWLFLGFPLSGTVITLGGLLASYTFGMLLNGIGYILPSKLWKWKGLALSDIEIENLEEIRNQKSFKYDFIHLVFPRVGARLAKISAERGLCRALMVGFFLLAVIYIFAAPQNPSSLPFWLVELGFLSALVAVFFLQKHLMLRAEEALRNNAILLREILDKLEAKTAKTVLDGLFPFPK